MEHVHTYLADHCRQTAFVDKDFNVTPGSGRVSETMGGGRSHVNGILDEVALGVDNGVTGIGGESRHGDSSSFVGSVGLPRWCHRGG